MIIGGKLKQSNSFVVNIKDKDLVRKLVKKSSYGMIQTMVGNSINRLVNNAVRNSLWILIVDASARSTVTRKQKKLLFKELIK